MLTPSNLCNTIGASSIKNFLLETNDLSLSTGMTESEKKAYKLGIYNSFAVINDFLDQNLNEDVPHYTVLLRDDIKSEEFTIDDFKKWTESREH